jgi:hypothetical protein
LTTARRRVTSSEAIHPDELPVSAKLAARRTALLFDACGGSL